MKARLSPILERAYPNLTPDIYRVTSKKDKNHNCVAWAAERDTKRWWEPLTEPGCYWPQGVPFSHDFQNYVKVFESLGYSQCGDSSLEEGFEKVALYRDVFGWFTHVCHQLEDGKWTSKLGPHEDVKHLTLESLETPVDGNVTVLMKRRRQIWEHSAEIQGQESVLKQILRWVIKKIFRPTNSA